MEYILKWSLLDSLYLLLRLRAVHVELWWWPSLHNIWKVSSVLSLAWGVLCLSEMADAYTALEYDGNPIVAI